MSMSLEDEILSAYVDGEIEPPHDESIRRQIEANEDIRRRYERFLELKRAFAGEILPDMSDAKRRVWENLQNLKPPQPSFWKQQWKLPAPVVAAAALIFAFLLGFSMWQIVTPTSQSPELAELGQEGRPVDLTINLADSEVQQVLDWLSSREMLGEIKVELPETHRFEIIGEAQLLRAADFARSRD